MEIPNISKEELFRRFGAMGSDVLEFNKHIKSQAVPYYSASEDEIRKFLIKRIGFMQEELSEISIAAYNNDITEIADGITDLIYFALGTMTLLDLPIDNIWNNVHSSNMTKVMGKTKRGIEDDAAKDESFLRPTISKILEQDRKSFLRLFNNI